MCGSVPACSVVQSGVVWCGVVQCTVVQCGVVQCGAVWCVVRGRNQQQRVWEVWSPNCNFPPQATTRPRNAVQGRKVVLVVHIATSASSARSATSATSAREYFNQCKYDVTSQFTLSCEWIGKMTRLLLLKAPLGMFDILPLVKYHPEDTRIFCWLGKWFLFAGFWNLK